MCISEQEQIQQQLQPEQNNVNEGQEESNNDEQEHHHACEPPNHILGYAIRSHTRIYISYLIPAILEVLVYIVQFVATLAVGYEDFHNHQPGFGIATLVLVLLPPILTFIFIATSKKQQSNPNHGDRKHFIGFHLLQMLLFPFFVIYRFALRIFWSIEALFQDHDDKERMLCLSRATECSTMELYNFIQAYAESAPQIILQIYHMLTLDMFRNYETTTAQAICLVFASIDLAAVTTSYQRFESQRQVGRKYPWAAPEQLEAQKQILESNRRCRSMSARCKRDSERTIKSFPESEKIMKNFITRNSEGTPDPSVRDTVFEPSISDEKTHSFAVHCDDEVDNKATDETPKVTTVLLHTESRPVSRNSSHNVTDDDKLLRDKARLHSIREEMRKANTIEILDTVPEMPAPPLPPLSQNSLSEPQGSPSVITLERTESQQRPPHEVLRSQLSTNSEATTTSTNANRNRRVSRPISQLDTFKDMLLFNAQMYIKENVPHPPKIFTKRVDDQEKENLLKSVSPHSPPPPYDETDFFLPRPTKIVNGIQQDDFAGKTIAFFGWISFIIMRMLSLATFCIFYPKEFFIIMSVHYVVMLVALFLETRQFIRGNLNRTLFYFLLSYVYVFVIIEFRIKFKNIQFWFISYFVITMCENITMTLIWYIREEFESWWFDFIYESILYSGIIFIATIIVYYCILKPKDVTLVVEDDVNTNED